MRRWLLWIPLALFLLFAAIFATGLIKPEGRVVRSQLVGKPLPEFALEQGVDSLPALGSDAFRDGKPKLLNLFASWCLPCAAEAPQLLALAREGVVIHAVAIRDKPEDIARFLDRYGNPYVRLGSDPTSSVQIALGSAGVPETFVIDGKGVIRYQHIGDIRPEDLAEIRAQLEAAK